MTVTSALCLHMHLPVVGSLCSGCQCPPPPGMVFLCLYVPLWTGFMDSRLTNRMRQRDRMSRPRLDYKKRDFHCGSSFSLSLRLLTVGRSAATS